MSGLRLKLLGGFELRPVSGEPIPLFAKKPALLLAYLALRPPGQPQGRDKLAGLLWGDSGDAQARHSLRQALAVLRRALGPHGDGLVLAPEGETLALAPDGLATDVAELERCLACGTRDALERAVALYGGDLLDGFRAPREPLLEEWLVGERQRLREAALSAMAALLPELEAAGPPEAGVRLGLRILALDPLQEAAHRALMRLHARQGRRGAALARYQGLREALARELGAAPEEETQRLYRELRDRRGAPDDRAATPAPAAGAGPAPVDTDAAGEPPPAEASAGAARPVHPPERRRLTVLVCDLCGAAALAARLDPEETHDLLGRYRSAVADEVARLEGHVARLTGGEAFAWFGWPRAQEDAAERAVRAGLAAVAAVARLKGPDDAPLAARVGVATGLVVVGDPAAAGPAGETAVVGPAAVLATGLQRLARPGTVLLSEETRGLVGGLFELEEPEPGVAATTAPAWRAVAERPVENRFEARRGPRAAAPMVGRDEELALLLRRWRLAAAGEGQAVLLVGEPGIGKSRIAEALVRTLGGEAHRLVRWQASPQHRNSALWPVAQQLARAAGLAAAGDDGAHHRHRLGRLEAALADLPGGRRAEALPFLAELLGIAAVDRRPPPELTPQQRRARTLEHLADLLLAAAEQEPVVAVTEDAHWLDPTSLELLGLLVDRIGARRVMLLVTSRPDGAPALAGYPHVTRVGLSRLARGDVEAIIGGLAGGRPLPGGLVEEIARRTDGVPLYVEELTKAVLEAGGRGEAGGPGGAADPVPVPASLHDSLMARLDRLGGAKEVAQAAACIGREFPHALVAAVLDHLPAAELEAALARLTAAELAFRRGTPPEATYSFKHALVRDAAYESLLKSRRRNLHARIAQVLEERFPEAVATGPELLAHHLEEARLTERAVDYWTLAGEHAARRSANLEAITALTRGLALVQRLPESDGRLQQELRLHVALCAVLTALKGYGAPETTAAFAATKALAERTGGDSSYLFPPLYGEYVVAVMQADYRRGEEVTARFVALAEKSADVGAVVIARRAHGVTRFMRGGLADSRHSLATAVALYDPDRDAALTFQYGLANPRVAALSFLGRSLHLCGHPEQARHRSAEAVALARATGHTNSLAFALIYGAAPQHHAAGDAAGLAVALREFNGLTEAQGLPMWRAYADVFEGWLMAQEGHASEGVTRVEAGLRDFAATASRFQHSQMLTVLAQALIADDRPAAALDALDAALGFVLWSDERYFEAELLRLRAACRLLLADGSREEAETDLGAALDVARSQGARAWELRAASDLARLWAERGEWRRAHDLLGPVHGWFTEGLDTPDLRAAGELLDGLR